VAVLEGFFLQSGPKEVALTGGRSRGVLITEFNRERDWGFGFGLNGGLNKSIYH